MNADQGFRRAPGNLLRVAAGAGAAAVIVAAVSAARRARTAMADRDSGEAHGSQVFPSAVPVPEVPEAVKACDPAVGQVAISAALLLVSVTALSAVAGRRRGGGKRGAAHARTTSGRQAENWDDAVPPEIPADNGDPWITGAPWSGRQDPAWHDADESWYDGLRGQHTDDYPSWPGRPGPYALTPDHPSWGGGRTDPRWDSTEAALRQDDYPGWPESAAPPWPDAEAPAANDASRWRGGGGPARQEPPPAAYRGPDGRPAGTDFAPRDGFAPRASSAAGPGPDPRLASAGYAPRPGPARQASPAPGPGPTYAPGPGPGPRAGYAQQGFASPGFAPQPGYPPGPGPARPGSAPRADVPRHGPVLQQGATGVMERVRPEVDRVREAGRVQSDQGQVWDAASVELATWIISEANQQATEIRHEARDDAATARADAKQEAARLVQQAADQAAATLAAAEVQAAKIRAGILKLSADLGGVATNFTEDLLSPAKPATKPAADPHPKLRAQAAAGVAAPPVTEAAAPSVSEPAAKLATRPAAKPAARPATKPVTRSVAAPATKPGVSPRRGKPETQAAGTKKNRQVSAARKVTAALVALTLAGVATGAVEVVLHGPAFFVFRANGAGASQTGPEEDQGPGQPNAPGAHHNAKVIPVKDKAKVIPAKGKHAKKDPNQAGNPT